MADTDMQTHTDEAVDKASSSARRGAETATNTAKQGMDTMSDTAKSGIDAEQRTFSAAHDATRRSAAALGQAAQTSMKAGQDMARHGQDIARRATDQAADFWRSSLTPMGQLSGEWNRLFDQMWRRAPLGLAASPMNLLGAFGAQPLADLRETGDGYELCVELAGLKAENIDLSLHGETLVLSGEKADERQDDQGGYRFSERRFGRFERVFALPPGADRTRIDASFQDGLLRVTIPLLAEGEAAKPIQIKG